MKQADDVRVIVRGKNGSIRVGLSRVIWFQEWLKANRLRVWPIRHGVAKK